MTIVKSGVSNYYGEVQVIENDSKYFMELEDYSGGSSVEISKEFYDAFITEFNKEKECTTTQSSE